MTDCSGCGYSSAHEQYDYCPYCGEELVDELEFPLEVDHYVHEQATRYDVEEDWGIDSEEYPELYESMRYIGYEEKLTYRVDEDGTAKVIAVNGREVKE